MLSRGAIDNRKGYQLWFWRFLKGLETDLRKFKGKVWWNIPERFICVLWVKNGKMGNKVELPERNFCKMCSNESKRVIVQMGILC